MYTTPVQKSAQSHNVWITLTEEQHYSPHHLTINSSGFKLKYLSFGRISNTTSTRRGTFKPVSWVASHLLVLWLYRRGLRCLEGAFCTSPGCTEHLGFCLCPCAVAEKPVFLKSEDGLMIRVSWVVWIVLHKDDFGGCLWDKMTFKHFGMLFIELSPVLIGVPGLIFDFHFSCHSVAVLTFVVVDGCDTWHHHTWQLIVPRTTTGAATRCQGQHHGGKLLSICVSVPQGNHQEGHILKHFSSFNYFLTWVFPHFSAKGILNLFPGPPPVSEWLLG